MTPLSDKASRLNRAPGTLLLIMLLPLAGMAAPPPAAAPSVIVEMAQRLDLIEEVPLSGSVISPHVANLSMEVSGIVETISVEIGDRIKQGEQILRLNSELSELSLLAARAMTAQAIAELEDSKRRLADAEALAERQTISVNELKSIAAEVRIDSAAVERYSAEQKRQEEQLRRHILSAPFSGIISKRLVERGEWLQAGAPVVELVSTTDLRIDFQAPQAVYAKLDQTSAVSVKLDAIPGRTFKGKIESIVPATDPTTRTFPVRVALSDPKVGMAPGMSASATLRLKTATRGIVVPRDAIIRYPDGRISVWVINQQGDSTTVSERQVQTGLSFQGKISINSGLSPDEQVVVQGNESLREGQSVTIKTAGSQARDK